MATSYVEEPHNLHEIEAYIITEKERMVQEIIAAEKCFFYDTCSFRKHANMEHAAYIFEFMKKCHGVIILTRCILMELASSSGMLNQEYTEYIRKAYEAGCKILLLKEEDLFDVLEVCFATNAVINRYLSQAVKIVKRPTSTIESTLQNNLGLRSDILREYTSERDLYRRFFQEVRAHKESGDNLGEELLTICVHLLANIPERQDYKYVVMTEDKGAVGLIHRAAKNVLQHLHVKAFTALTTIRLAQRLYEEQILTDKAQVEEVLSVGTANPMVKFLGSEEYDLEPVLKTMPRQELAQKIVTPNAIHINY